MRENITKDGMAWHRNGSNLHIFLQTEPDTATLASMSTLLKSCGAPGRVFVDVRGLSGSMPARTVRSFKYVVSHSPVPAQSVYFKGPMGFTLASDGNRVIIVGDRDGTKRGAGAAQAKERAGGRPHRCSCGGKCGDRCCQVTGGPCCGGKGHHHHGEDDA